MGNHIRTIYCIKQFVKFILCKQMQQIYFIQPLNFTGFTMLPIEFIICLFVISTLLILKGVDHVIVSRWGCSIEN